MGTCIYCGKEAADSGGGFHDECRRNYERQHVAVVPATTAATPSAQEDVPIGLVVLNMLGFIAMGIGLYLLLGDPSEAPQTYSVIPEPRVINLHRVFIGQTFTVVGAVFLAAAWRPRSRSRT